MRSPTLAQLAPVGVAEREHEADHDPEQRRLPAPWRSVRGTAPAPCRRETRSARPCRQARRNRSAGKARDRAFVVARDQDDQRQRKADQAGPRRRRRRTGPSAIAGAAVRVPSAMACEPLGQLRHDAGALGVAYLVQCAISSRLRPQPEHSPEPGSSVQIFSQGEIDRGHVSGHVGGIATAPK